MLVKSLSGRYEACDKSKTNWSQKIKSQSVFNQSKSRAVMKFPELKLVMFVLRV